MKNIQTNSYKKTIKQAASFEGTGKIAIEVFDSGWPVRIEYTMSGNEWSGDYMNPPESSIDDIFIENLEEVIDQLCNDGEESEGVPHTFTKIDDAKYQHKSGEIYTKKDILTILGEKVSDNL